MKYKKNVFKVLLMLIFSMLSIISCNSNRNDTVNCFPISQINVQIYINSAAYFNLQTVGNWVYINEQQCGTRGLIVVRTSSGFKIYDRNAPHICPTAQSTLEVKDNIKIICPQDNAEWILLSGEPINVAKVAPKTYNYSYNPSNNLLSIYN